MGRGVAVGAGVGTGSGVGVGVGNGVGVGVGVAVGSGVDVGVGSPAIRVASREAANRSASCSASIAVRVAWSSRRRWASMASMTVFVASMSGVGLIVGNGVGVFKTAPGVTSSPKSDLTWLLGIAKPIPAMSLPPL